MEHCKSGKKKGERKEIAGPGYDNFYLDYAKFAPDVLKKVMKEKKDYGRGENKGKVIVEHTSANPDGPLHIGHGRNAIIGDSIARILAFSGYAVSRELYVNDAGKQVALACWQYLRAPSKPKGKKDYWVLDLYLKANRHMENEDISEELSDIMLAYEKKDKKTDSAVRLLVGSCIEGHEKTLKRLGIGFDSFAWESRFMREGSASRLISKIEKNEYAVSEGKMLALDLSKFGVEKALLVRRSDGTMLYSIRDLAYHIDKFKRAKHIVDVLGCDHKLHFIQLKHALGLLGKDTSGMNVIHYEFISLPEGQMSTRKGKFIALDDLLDEAVARAKKEVDKRRKDLSEREKKAISEAVGLGAIRYFIAGTSPEKPITFEWNKALDFEQSSAPAIQYAYARACKILDKSGKRETKCKDLAKEEKNLIRKISKFGGVVGSASSDLRDHYIAVYASELVSAFKKFYTSCRVIGSDEERFRCALVFSARQTLENCLGLLGIKPLKNM